MADHGRDDRGSLDHVGDRAGKVPYNLAGQTDLFFDEGIGAVLVKPLLRLGTAQSAVGFNGELGKHLIDRHLLEVDRIIGLGGNAEGCRTGADMDYSPKRDQPFDQLLVAQSKSVRARSVYGILRHRLRPRNCTKGHNRRPNGS